MSEFDKYGPEWGLDLKEWVPRLTEPGFIEAADWSKPANKHYCDLCLRLAAGSTKLKLADLREAGPWKAAVAKAAIMGKIECMR